MAGDVPLMLIEAAIRGGAVTLLAVLALLLLRDARRSPAGLYGAFFSISVVGYVISSAPGLGAHVPARWLLPPLLLSIGTPAAFWLFTRAIFDDAFKPAWRDCLWWLGLVTIGFLCARGLVPQVCTLLTLLQLAFAALAIRQAIVGRTGDLVEDRRRFRVVMVVISAIYIVLTVLQELAMRGPSAMPPLSTINAAGILAITVAYLTQRLALTPRGVVAERPTASRSITQDSPSPPPIDGQERALLDRLRGVMEKEKAYREEGLTITVLAAKLGVPEYRLRRLINQRLGHRNFSSYVNRYRLTDAMAALADPNQLEVPIVTIALDAGFQSLGPFNRAFKAQTGMTPTDYRRRLARGDEPPKSSWYPADSGIG